MITIIDTGKLVDTQVTPANPKQAVLTGLSTDDKPTTGVGNGWMFVEMDTSTVYLFDSANSEWLAFGSSGGGGGQGGNSGMIVNAIYDEGTDSFTLDKTAGEIMAAAPLVGVKFVDGTEVNVYNFTRFGAIDNADFIFTYQSAAMEEQHFEAATASDYPTMPN